MNAPFEERMIRMVVSIQCSLLVKEFRVIKVAFLTFFFDKYRNKFVSILFHITTAKSEIISEGAEVATLLI